MHDSGFEATYRGPRDPDMSPRFESRHNGMPVNENRRLATISRQAPRIEWSQFLREHFQWKPGEHLGLIGPTGSGKTTLLLNLIPLRTYATVFATKPRDATMDYLIKRMGYVKFERWQSLDPRKWPRRVIWPDATRIDSDEKQREVFHHAFSCIYREQDWTLIIDELWFISEHLKLRNDVKVFLQQARSLGISLCCATQRPAWVPLEVYDQSTHLFFWRDNDERNLSRLSGISWRSAETVKNAIAGLEMHQVLYVNTRLGTMIRTRCPAIST